MSLYNPTPTFASLDESHLATLSKFRPSFTLNYFPLLIPHFDHAFTPRPSLINIDQTLRYEVETAVHRFKRQRGKLLAME